MKNWNSLRKWVVAGSVVLLGAGCAKDDGGTIPVTPPGNVGTPVDGVRMAWDYSSLSAIAPEDAHASVCELRDGTLLVVWSAEGECFACRSADGRKWGYTIRMLSGGYGDPSVTCLADGRACVAAVHTDDAGVASIVLAESGDGGFTWSVPRTVRTASDAAETCSGPALLQLRDGSLHCYFSGTDEESAGSCIRVAVSADGGISWSDPETCSRTPGGSDTSVSPALFRDRIVLAFQSVAADGTVRVQTLSKPVGAAWGTAERRDVAVGSGDNAPGRPSLAAFGDRAALAYETTGGDDSQRRMLRVVLGCGDAEGWTNPTEPFRAPVTEGSLVALSDGSLLAVGRTPRFAPTPQPCAIRGYAIPELKALRSHIDLDGALTGEEWGDVLPVFVGHRGETRMRASLRLDGNRLCVGAEVWDDTQITGLPGIRDNYAANGKGIDGVTLYLDPTGNCYDALADGMYKLQTVPDGGYALMEYRDGIWNRRYETSGVEVRTQRLDARYFVEMALSLPALGKHDPKPMRLTFGLNASDGTTKYEETVALSAADRPNTWCRVAFE